MAQSKSVFGANVRAVAWRVRILAAMSEAILVQR